MTSASRGVRSESRHNGAEKLGVVFAELEPADG